MTLPRLLRILALVLLVVGVWVAIVVFHDRTVVRGEMPGIEVNPWRWVALAVAVFGSVGLAWLRSWSNPDVPKIALTPQPDRPARQVHYSSLWSG